MDKPCCDGSGFVGKVICVWHLQQAFEMAVAWGDKELASVILSKQMGKI